MSTLPSSTLTEIMRSAIRMRSTRRCLIHEGSAGAMRTSPCGAHGSMRKRLRSHSNGAADAHASGEHDVWYAAGVAGCPR